MIFYGHWPANFKEQGRRVYTAEHIGQAGKNVTQWENERQERSHHTMSIPIQLLYSYVGSDLHHLRKGACQKSGQKLFVLMGQSPTAHHLQLSNLVFAPISTYSLA